MALGQGAPASGLEAFAHQNIGTKNKFPAAAANTKRGELP
jgi:hypothetical protein